MGSLEPPISGFLVIAEVFQGRILPVTRELLGEAVRLGRRAGGEVSCLVLSPGDLREDPAVLGQAGADRVWVCRDPRLAAPNTRLSAAVTAGAVGRLRPLAVLIPGTDGGRALAAAQAVYWRSGVTADCTELDYRPEAGVVQIRPAYGGRVMARIITPAARPQVVLVRPGVMRKLSREEVGEEVGEGIGKGGRSEADCRTYEARELLDGMKGQGGVFPGDLRVLESRERPKGSPLAGARVLVAAGLGVQKREDLEQLRELAELLGGELAGTRPVVERGWLPRERQIGLSGQAVQPELLLTAGVSGSLQFQAGIANCGYLIAVNSDPGAPILSAAHQPVRGDLYEVIPRLIQRLKEQQR